MYLKHLACEDCGETYTKDKARYYCICGGVVRIVYDYAGIKRAVSWKKLRSRPFNHYRYKEFYPATDAVVSLNEGGTPLVRSVQRKNLYFKIEGQNPTGSFKDRGTTLELSHAVDMGAKHIVCASTGNMGASVAAYCARSGIPCQIVVPKGTERNKLRQIRNFGATVQEVVGDYTVAMRTAYRLFRSNKAYLVGDYAYRGEGEKSVGFEIADQLSTVDYIVCPIGNGTLISGIWRGLNEMKIAGLVKRLPRLIGVQANGCNPVAIAFKTGKMIRSVIPHTLAGAIACGAPIDGASALHAVKESKGVIVSVSDKEILNARQHLAHTEGLDTEPSGAATYAALQQAKIPKNKKTVLILTGHGLKDLEHS